MGLQNKSEKKKLVKETFSSSSNASTSFYWSSWMKDMNNFIKQTMLIKKKKKKTLSNNASSPTQQILPNKIKRVTATTSVLAQVRGYFFMDFITHLFTSNRHIIWIIFLSSNKISKFCNLGNIT